MSNFVHLHVHTQYSILDGASSVKGLVSKAISLGMRAIAITDHGNMFAIKEFVNEVDKANQPTKEQIKVAHAELDQLMKSDTPQAEGVKNLESRINQLSSKLLKPIIGCEAYVAKNSRFDQVDKDDRGGYHLVLLAKNAQGYKNLMKLVSYSYIEGFYYKPRMDMELLRKYNEGIIACSACLGGVIPQAILSGNSLLAHELAAELKEIYGEDFYLEVMAHPVPTESPERETYNQQLLVNKALLGMSSELGIKCIATNDVHFVNAQDAMAHDRLICLNTGKEIDDPNRMRYTTQEYLKSEQEMRTLFPQTPEVIANTLEVASKVEVFQLNQDPIMPHFQLPDGFTNHNDYLRHITTKGAEKRWGSNLSNTVRERLDFELEVIARMGYPSYFLIIWDLLEAARGMGVSVGPGRGSAAGSAVAYCLRITDIDPIKYNLLFERFLNPERISMPDIDIDFDEDGRERVLKWVVEKYGKKRVAHIITFGTMAAKMAIRDVARVQKLPLSDANRLAKLVPEKPGITLAQAYKEVPELEQSRKSPDELIRTTLQYAEVLEGSVRQTGVHACGIIIGRDDLEEHIPLCTAKDAELYATQYDGKHVEAVGLLKMDFLGLKTLSIIKDTLSFIKDSKGVELNIDALPLDDQKTFDLYTNGETTALFQFESANMKKHLRALKPNRFEDLIAMNALYRPGPMDYIPSFISRKHGRERIDYDIPQMQEYLEETYGITVYQEQVMLLSQKLAGFTKGQADSLRKAMGKKLLAEMNKLKQLFIEGCSAKGYDPKKVEKIWTDWEAFAEYAFNKSHSTCYALVSYQTAYLKAHYPSEFMAAVLGRNLSDIKKITIFMDECRRMGIQVLGPDVNESGYKFRVMPNGDIRFGLGAIKGVGEGAVTNIIETRAAKGRYSSIHDFVEKINLQSVNKKTIEALAMAGAFDNLGIDSRAQLFAPDPKGTVFIEQLIRYGSKVQQEKNNVQQSLFGDMASGFGIQKPELPKVDDWPATEKLNREKELIGIYLSAHPLDEYKLEVKHFTNYSLSEMNQIDQLMGQEVAIAGIISSASILTSKTGKPFGKITLEDFTDTWEFPLFGKDFENYRKFLYAGYSILVKGKVEPSRFRNNEPEFTIKSMHMLREVRDEMVKTITLSITLNQINDDLIGKFKIVVEANKGKVQVNFRVIDAESSIFVELFSRTHRISLTNELLTWLNESGIEYSINTPSRWVAL